MKNNQVRKWLTYVLASIFYLSTAALWTKYDFRFDGNCDPYDLGPTLILRILFCYYEKHFTTFSLAWQRKEAALNYAIQRKRKT